LNHLNQRAISIALPTTTSLTDMKKESILPLRPKKQKLMTQFSKQKRKKSWI